MPVCCDREKLSFGKVENRCDRFVGFLTLVVLNCLDMLALLGKMILF